MANKVRFGLKKAYYSVVSVADNVPSFAAPVAMPGAVSISIDPEGDSSSFYADDILYDYGSTNNGYKGTLELALVPDSFWEDVLGMSLDSNSVMIEKATDEPVYFALLFEFTGDADAIRHCYYYCKASRPKLEGKTKGDSRDVQTTEFDFAALPEPGASIVKASTVAATNAARYEAWYTAVALPTYASVPAPAKSKKEN